MSRTIFPVCFIAGDPEGTLGQLQPACRDSEKSINLLSCSPCFVLLFCCRIITRKKVMHFVSV